jgi:hypothetical protein
MNIIRIGFFAVDNHIHIDNIEAQLSIFVHFIILINSFQRNILGKTFDRPYRPKLILLFFFLSLINNISSEFDIQLIFVHIVQQKLIHRGIWKRDFGSSHIVDKYRNHFPGEHHQFRTSHCIDFVRSVAENIGQISQFRTQFLWIYRILLVVAGRGHLCLSNPLLSPSFRSVPAGTNCHRWIAKNNLCILLGSS